MSTTPAIAELVARFSEHLDHYTSPEYKEAHLRSEFLDPFFVALGWDVGNTQGFAEAFKDVVVEDSLVIRGSARSPDYAFRIGGQTQFYAEAKKPSVNLLMSPEPALQLRRYAWTKGLPIGVLTDFQELAVYDARVRPTGKDDARTGRVLYFTFREYEARWTEIASLLAKEAIQRGALERFVSEQAKRKGTAEVDEAFLADIETWRELLAKDLYKLNKSLSLSELNYAVQLTLDRILFLRICEDRNIEVFGRLLDTAKTPGVCHKLIEIFEEADVRFNSGLFHFRNEKDRHEPPDDLTPNLRISDKVLSVIITALYPPKSPYAFRVLPADVLGQVYERFLGKTIVLRGRGIAVVSKPEVRKAGGVVYTPSLIARYIVQHTVAKGLEGGTPNTVKSFHILDPACGSGSFLLEAYDYLLRWYRDWYINHSPQRRASGKKPVLRQTVGNDWQLTTGERKRILLRHIYGVDIDPQAVEVTKLSLLLKVLEGETQEQLALLHDRALPDLGNNIKCGNSLIEPHFYTVTQLSLMDTEVTASINAFDWKSEYQKIFEGGGFDVVLGNPPYILLQGKFRDDDQLAYFKTNFEVAAYKIDTYHLFIERGIHLTKPNGRTSMIVPSNLLTNNYLKTLRRFMLEKARLGDLLVIDKGVFKGISVDNAVFVANVGRAGKRFDVVHTLPNERELVETSRNAVSVSDALASEHVLFTGTADPRLERVWNRMDEGCSPLGELAYVNFGKQLRDRSEYLKDVVEIDSSDQLATGYAPCYTGRDVTRYVLEWSGLACLTTRRAKKGGCWDDDKQNAKHKLLTRQVGKHPEFAYDELGYQCLNTMFMVNVFVDRLSPLYVLGCLNSDVVKGWWLDKYYDRRRTFPKIKGTYLKAIPIPDRPKPEEQQHIVRLVRRRLEVAKTMSVARTKVALERSQRDADTVEKLIEEAVRQMYELSKEDVETIQNAFG